MDSNSESPFGPAPRLHNELWKDYKSTSRAHANVLRILGMDCPGVHNLRCRSLVSEAHVQAGQHVPLCGGMAGMAAAVITEEGICMYETAVACISSQAIQVNEVARHGSAALKKKTIHGNC